MEFCEKASKTREKSEKCLKTCENLQHCKLELAKNKMQNSHDYIS